MVDPVATPSDVRVEISTYLDDTEITPIIERVSRDIERDDDVVGLDGPDRKDLEAVLAARHIATTRDRAESSSSAGPASVEYEQSLIDELTARARRLGATDELLGLEATKPTATIDVPETRG
ncbi:hypothetical protein GWK26_12610 [haloarchaeon 3A1-DGR]|nr:hypothetical protein GWK26_12610 [haloarchaeon 3A1-DGR]